MSSDRPFTFPVRRRSRALAGMLAAALLIAACSQGTPEPTATPIPTQPPAAADVATAIPTVEVTPESVLGPVEPTAIPLATATDAAVAAAASALQSPLATPEAGAQAAATPEAQPAVTVTSPIDASTPVTLTTRTADGAPLTGGTWVEDNTLCEQLIGEAVPDGLLPYLRCGVFTVPEDHANPQGPKVGLPVVVLKSASVTPAPDPVLVLQGGPGGSGIREYFSQILSQGFRAGDDRDVILVDQRGSFYATPALTCPEYREVALQHIQSGKRGPEAEQERLAASAACKARLAGEGVNLSVFNSFENAADIAALPRALGYTDYNIYGISYGSLLAQHILARHPQGVRSLILDGVTPRAGKFLLTRNANFQRALQKVAEACKADARCAKDYPDVEARFIKLVNDLNASPAPMQITTDSLSQTVTLDAPLTGEALLATIYTMLFDSYGISRLPRLVDLVEKKDFEYLARLRDLFELQVLNQTTIGLFNSIYCSEDANFTEDEAEQADAATRAELNVFRSATEFLSACKDWNVASLGDEAHTPISSDVPVLVLNGEFDPLTPQELNAEAISGFSNATEVTFPGRGHGQFPDNGCAASLVSNFLNAPTVPLDLQCAQTMPPLEFSTVSLELTPFTDLSAGLGSVRPVGWIQVGPGNFADDITVAALSFGVNESTSAEVLQRTLEEANAKRVGERQTANLDWALYEGKTDGSSVDIALSHDGRYKIMLLAADEAQHKTLYDGAFLPAIDQFVAIQAPKQNIVLSSPQPDAEVVSPVRVSGVTAKTPFENNLVYRIFNGADLIISEGPINVKGELGGPGTFAASLPFTVTQREAGRIEVVDIDAATGDTLATAAVSVTLAPAVVEGQRPVITITVELPQPNAVITSPAQVQGGITLTPFENTLVYRVFDGAGNLIGIGPITVQGDLGQPATFDASVVFTSTQSGLGRLVIEDDNEAGGPPLATAALDVQFGGPDAPVAAVAAVAPAELVTPTTEISATAVATPTAIVTPTEAITPTAVVTLTDVMTATAAVAPTTEVTAPVAVTSAVQIEALNLDDFTLNPSGVARSVRKQLLPAVPFNPNEPLGGSGFPERVRFVFDRDQVADYFAPRQRQLLILPIEQYRALYTGTDLEQLDQQIAGLRDLLAQRPTIVTDTITVLPALPSSQMLRANVDYIDFNGGSCVRFITAYRFDVSPITDSDLVYTCQGLSSDGKYYVSFTAPIASTATPSDINDVTRAQQAQINANYTSYLNSLVNSLDALAPGNFRPNLAALDKMLGTLTIKE